jgi:hypothetical protein
MQLAAKSQDLVGIIPDISFFEFMNLVQNNPYNGEKEFIEIRNKLPQEIINNDIKSGVFGNNEGEE